MVNEDLYVGLGILLVIAMILCSIAIPVYLFQTSEAGMYKECLDNCRWSEIENRENCITECNSEFEYCKNNEEVKKW